MWTSWLAIVWNSSEYPLTSKRHRAFLTVLPSLTVATGLGVAQAGSGAASPPNPPLSVALLLVTLAPLVGTGVIRKAIPGIDYILISIASMLVAMGSVTLFMLATGERGDDAFYSTIVTRHGIFVLVGYIALIAGALSSHGIDRVIKYPFSLLGIALLMTLLTIGFGESVNGARLWLQFGPVRFQPSEVTKLFIATFVAIFLYERRHLVAANWRMGAVDAPPLPYLMPLAAAMVGAAGVLVFQNDLGMAALVVLGAFASVVTVISSRGTIVLATGVVLIAIAGSFRMVSRVRDRFAGWLDPWQDPAGRGFQFVQADYSLAAGGLSGTGSGLAATTVPEVHTDLIMIGAGSQLGLLGSVGLLALTSLFVCRCVLASLQARNGFSGLLALTITALIGIQIILIGGGTLRVLPLTGLTFPLVSYGGSSMVVTLFALGLIAGIGSARTDNAP